MPAPCGPRPLRREGEGESRCLQDAIGVCKMHNQTNGSSKSVHPHTWYSNFFGAMREVGLREGMRDGRC